MAAPVRNAKVRQAVQMAALDWIAQHGDQSKAARAAKDLRGVDVKQQMLGYAAKGEKIGPKLTDDLAEIYETTGDGLVAMFLGAKVIALRDLPGWKRAKEEAMAKAGNTLQSWVWREIDNVTVPGRVKTIDSSFIAQLAFLLNMHGQGSGIQARVR